MPEPFVDLNTSLDGDAAAVTLGELHLEALLAADAGTADEAHRRWG